MAETEKASTKADEKVEDKPAKGNQKAIPQEDNLHKIAIMVHNGEYGFYVNESRLKLAQLKYTEAQIEEIMTIVENIK